MLMKECKIFLTVLLTSLLLGNTFGSMAVNAAEASDTQAEQITANTDEYKHFGFPTMIILLTEQSIKREMPQHLKSILHRQ